MPTRRRDPAWAVVLASGLVPLNSTMVAVALARIAADLDVSAATATWVVTGYLLAMAAAQPVGGKLGDRLGHRRVLLWGVAAFAVASLAAAAAPALPALVAARVGQALAGALIVPNGMALLRSAPGGRLGRRLGALGAAMTLAAAVGPPLGAALLAAAGWRGLFLANLPIVLAAAAIARRDLPDSPPPARRARFDVAGAALLAVALCAGAAALGATPAPLAWPLAALAASALALLVRGQARHGDPLLAPRLLAPRGFVAATAAIAATNLALYALLIATPLLLASRGWDPAAAALLLGALSLAAFAASPPGGRLADARGSRTPALVGAAAVALGLVPLATAAGTLGAPALAAALVAAGVGVGLATPALNAAALASAAPSDAGAAAGMISLARYAGSIAGTALLARILSGAGGGTAGYEAAFAAVLGVALCALAAALALPRGRRRAGATAGGALAG